MPWVDQFGTEHPAQNDDVDIKGMRHIQACPHCRAVFPNWVPMLDAAASWERGEDGHPES